MTLYQSQSPQPESRVTLKASSYLLIVSCMLWLSAPHVSAQGMVGDLSFTKTCISDIASPIGQSVSVDERNDVHWSRIDPSSRALIYSRLTPDAPLSREVIAEPVDLEVSPVGDTDILARRDQVFVLLLEPRDRNGNSCD